MEKDLSVWENSTGMMFICWYERHTSVIYPNEPRNIEAMANIIGTPVENVHNAIARWQNRKLPIEDNP